MSDEYDDEGDDEGGEEEFNDGLYTGYCADNADPERRYRIRIRSPNTAEPHGAWARPGFLPGMGGTKGAPRGLVMIPMIGDMVDFHFLAGDETQPVYYPSGAIEGNLLSHAKNPPRGGAVSPEDMYRLWGWEGERFAFQVDERPGNEYLRMIDKGPPGAAPPEDPDDKNEVEIDAKTGVTSMHGRQAVALISKKGVVTIFGGLGVTIQKRPVDGSTTEPL